MSTDQDNRTRQLMLFTGVIVLFGAIGIWAGLQIQRPGAADPPPLQAGTLYPTPRDFGAFQLIDDRGDSFGPERWQGDWRLVFFGFTHCPDVCPTTMSMLGQLRDRLPRDRQPIVTFVSVDPERDDPQRIGDYARYFDESFEAATGSPQQLQALTRKMGIVFVIEPHEEGAMDYAVDHSAAILMLGPDGRIHAVFTAPHDPVAMAGDIRKLMEGSSS